MAGAAFLSCATFSARAIRRIRSSARARSGFAESRQIAGSFTAGGTNAAAPNASARSLAAKATTSVPAPSLIVTVLNLARPLPAANVSCSGPRRASSAFSIVPRIRVTLRAPPAAA